MPGQFKTARQINKLKITEAAEKLGISQPTLSAWEGERKSPSIDKLEHMAELYGVTTDFLLGRTETQSQDPRQPIPLQALPAFHGRPVWSASYGWLLVNAADKLMTFPDGRTMPFADIIRKELQGWYHVKDRFVENEYGNRFYLDTYGSKWLAFLSENE